jgi:hypothetical protein
MRRAAVVRAVRARMTPNVTAAVSLFRRVHKFLNGRFETVNRHRLFETLRRSMRNDDWMEVGFVVTRNDNDGRRWTPGSDRFEDTQAVHAWIGIEHDQCNIRQAILRQREKIA